MIIIIVLTLLQKMSLTFGYRQFHHCELFIPAENERAICNKALKLPTKAAERQKLVHLSSCLTLIFFYYEKTQGGMWKPDSLVA